jgi:hypothetical protein
MDDSRGILKQLKLQAHPEVCRGTPESVESKGREVARRGKHSSTAELLRLTPEPVPADTPPGWRAFRFTHPKRVYLGTVCGVVYDQESGNTVFVMSDSPLPNSITPSNPVCFARTQDGPEPQASHILIPPNGYVSRELVESH